MKTSTNPKVNELTDNQNEMLARVPGLRVRTNVKAGGEPPPPPSALTKNHNETLRVRTNAGLRVRTNVKAGGSIIAI